MGREMVTSPGAGEGGPPQTPRLVITRMELVNFKSYAGTKAIGPFHKCFSSVVGPNGSGKSNVIDAMLFVFGKKAKQLRLNKVSELIHNSTHHQNLLYAEVSVYFQMIIDLDDENFEPVPGTELVVSRRANRDNSSKYMINGKNSTFTEVTALLKGKGIDLDNNRFLILQGEVEQIAMMKPKAQGPHDEGLLEYLSDIIGCDHYNEQIDQASQRVEQFSDERTGKLQHVKIAEKQMSSLEGAKAEAELYIRKESELLQAKVVDLQLCLLENEKALASNKEGQAGLEKKLEDERAKRADDEAQAKLLEKEFNVHRKDFEKIEAELDSAKQQFAEFERKDVKMREDLKHLKEKLKKLDQKAKKDAQKRGELEKESADAVESIPRLEAEHAQFLVDLPAQEKLLDEYKEKAKAEMEKYRERLQAAHIELEPYEKESSEAKARMDVATAERKLLVEKHASAEKAYTDAAAAQKETEAGIANTDKEIKSISGAVQQKKKDAAAAREEERACQASEVAVSSEVQALRGKVGDLRSARDAEKSRGAISRAFSAAKREGRIPGFLGRLGDLGAIDAKYDVAISTGCGQLDSFLVDNARTAQECIKILKEQQLGVATFITLDKQQHFQAAMNDPVQTPEGVPRLFDLITFAAEQVKPAFWYALRNTVVAENLDQAQRIAYGRDTRFRRVVTLQGQVIESSGTMSGGGRPQSGKMGSRLDKGLGVSDRELEGLERQLAVKVAELEELRARGQAAGTAAERAERELAELEMRLPKAKIELDALRTQLSDLSRRMAGLEAAAHPSQEELERVKQLEREVSKEERDLAKVEKASAHLRMKAEEIQSQMDNAGGEQLKKQKEEVEKLQKTIDATTTEINRLKVLIKTHGKAVERLTKLAEDGEKEKAKIKDQMEKVTSELRGLEQEALKVKELYEQTQEVLESKRGEMEAIQAEYSKRKAVVDSFLLGEVDLQTQLEDAVRMVRVIQQEGKALEKRLADVRKKQEQHLTTLDLSEEEAAALLAPPAEDGAAPETQEEVQERIQALEAALKDMKPNMASIAEYRKKEADYNEKVRDLDSVTSARDAARKEHTELRKRRLDEFMAGFNVITMKLKEMYQMITLGGDAELELVDSLDPFSEGIVFSVRPPKKSWKNISNLSGGEKTLSSLALVFALHHYKPTPLYVMDEIDAALDFKNVSIVAHYIKDRTKDAQFIIISLRNNMFELADRLVGIYKTDNCTKSITINPRSFAVAAAT